MKKKLVLNKETVVKLAETDMMKLKGGARTAHSTKRGFLCCWCTFGSDEVPDTEPLK